MIYDLENFQKDSLKIPPQPQRLCKRTFDRRRWHIGRHFAEKVLKASHDGEREGAAFCPLEQSFCPFPLTCTQLRPDHGFPGRRLPIYDAIHARPSRSTTPATGVSFGRMVIGCCHTDGWVRQVFEKVASFVKAISHCSCLPEEFDFQLLNGAREKSKQV